MPVPLALVRGGRVRSHDARMAPRVPRLLVASIVIARPSKARIGVIVAYFSYGGRGQGMVYYLLDRGY